MFTLLRLAKKNPAAATMIAQPAIVKSVVPIPPVDGREESFESSYSKLSYVKFPTVVVVFKVVTSTVDPLNSLFS